MYIIRLNIVVVVPLLLVEDKSTDTLHNIRRYKFLLKTPQERYKESRARTSSSIKQRKLVERGSFQEYLAISLGTRFVK